MFDLFERKYFVLTALCLLGLLFAGTSQANFSENLRSILEKRNVAILHDVPVTIQEIYVEGIVLNIICYVDGVRAEDLNPDLNDMLGIIFKETEGNSTPQSIAAFYVYFYMIHSADDEKGSMLYGVVKSISGSGAFTDNETARLFLIGDKP